MAYYRQEGDLISAPFGTNEIKSGQLVTVDASGNAKAGETGAKPFLGIAMEDTASLAGKSVVRIWKTGVFPIAIDAAAATDLGKTVAIATPDKVTTTTSGTAPAVAQIVEIIDETTVGIRLI